MKPVVITGHSMPVKDIKFNLEDDVFFTASVDRYISLWSSETNERIGTYFHEAAVNCMAITPDCKYLISGDNVGCIYIWEAMTGINLAVINSGIKSATTSIDLGVSDRQLLVSFPCRAKSDRGSIITFNFEDVLKGKPKEIKDNKYSTDINNKDIKYYDLNSIPYKKIISDTDHKITNSKFLNTNKQVLCAFDNGLVQLRDLESQKILNESQLHYDDKNQGCPIMELNLSAKEELALSSGKDGRSVLFDPETLEVLNVFKPDNPQRNINSGKISPLFNPDLNEKDQLRHVIVGGGQDAKNVTFTRSTEGGFEILIYDMITGEELGSISGHFSPINTIGVSHNGKIIASGGEESVVRVYNLPNEYYQMKDY